MWYVKWYVNKGFIPLITMTYLYKQGGRGGGVGET